MTSKRSKRNTYIIRRVLFCILLLVLTLFLIRKLFWPEHFNGLDYDKLFGEHKLIFFSSNEIQVAEDVKRNIWDPELFEIDDNGLMHYKDPNTQTCLGIDVSSFQKDIDWEKVKNSGIDFVFIRAGYRGTTEGGLFIDPNFNVNYEGAKKAGLKIGIYFFSQSINEAEAAEEADYVVSLIDGKEIDLPIVFDWEYVSDTARTANITKEVMSNCADAFYSRIRQHGYDCMIYFNLYTSYMIYDMNDFGDKLIWLAQFAEKPTYYYHYEIWQYSCTGRIDGIETDVDLNIALDSDIVSTIKD